MKVRKVSVGILKDFSSSRSYGNRSTVNTDRIIASFRVLRSCGKSMGGDDDTWKMVYMVTVSGRLPEYSAILKMSIPHLFTSSISCQRTICMNA